MSTLAVPVSVKRSSSQRSPPRAKRGAGVRRTNSFNLLARPSKPGDRLNVELLYSLTPYKDNLDEVSEYARSILINAIKMEPHVHDIFFPNENPDPVLDYLDTRGFPIDKLATALVAESISKIKDEFKFHQMIDKSSLQDVLRDIYNGLQWKKIGRLRKHVNLRSYSFVKRDNGFLEMTISNFTQFKITCNIYQLLILNAIKCKLYSKLRYME